MQPFYARPVMGRRRFVLASGAALLLSACSARVGTVATDQLRIMVPNAAGGGYATTARILAGVIESEGLGERPEIFNLEGASGAGLVRTVHERGNADLMMMMGLGVVGSILQPHRRGPRRG